MGERRQLLTGVVKPRTDFAAQLGQRVHAFFPNVVEVVPGYFTAELPSSLVEKSKKLAWQKLNGVARAAKLTPDIEVQSAKPQTAFLALFVEKDADLIVIVSHQPEI